jgi:hypothetical protein
VAKGDGLYLATVNIGFPVEVPPNTGGEGGVLRKPPGPSNGVPEESLPAATNDPVGINGPGLENLVNPTPDTGDGPAACEGPPEVRSTAAAVVLATNERPAKIAGPPGLPKAPPEAMIGGPPGLPGRPLDPKVGGPLSAPMAPPESITGSPLDMPAELLARKTGSPPGSPKDPPVSIIGGPPNALAILSPSAFGPPGEPIEPPPVIIGGPSK